MKYILQIIHDLPEGGQNVIEHEFAKIYQIDAEERRHSRFPHREGVRCEMHRIQDFTI